jgi:maleylpyruvate isomerase
MIDATDLGELAWAREVYLGTVLEPAGSVVLHRLREVEAHHVDLAAGYTFADLAMDVVAGFLDQVPVRFSGTSLDPCTLVATDARREWQVGTAGGPRVSGPAAVLLPWVMGRGGGEGLTADAGTVPASPGWG